MFYDSEAIYREQRKSELRDRLIRTQTQIDERIRLAAVSEEEHLEVKEPYRKDIGGKSP